MKIAACKPRRLLQNIEGSIFLAELLPTFGQSDDIDLDSLAIWASQRNPKNIVKPSKQTTHPSKAQLPVTRFQRCKQQSLATRQHMS